MVNQKKKSQQTKKLQPTPTLVNVVTNPELERWMTCDIDTLAEAELSAGVIFLNKAIEANEKLKLDEFVMQQRNRVIDLLEAWLNKTKDLLPNWVAISHEQYLRDGGRACNRIAEAVKEKDDAKAAEFWEKGALLFEKLLQYYPNQPDWVAISHEQYLQKGDYAMTKNKKGKIHFVHHLEKSYAAANLGDWISSPYYYFLDFFSQYTCVLHSDWAVLWHEIERGDVVIFGGGGLLDNSDPLNVVLNRLLEKCDNVIIWGAGTHKYNKDNIFERKSATTLIHFDKAALCGIRDYEHPYNQSFVPCASCLHPAFSADKHSVKIEREIGTIRSALENSFAVSGVPSSVSNAEPIGTIVNYILSSNVILVSSYHGAFWSLLLGRKVILPASRLGVDKYKYFRYPVGFYEGSEYDENELLRIASEIPEHPDFLAEARALNIGFFKKVRDIVEERIAKPSETETIQILSKRTAQLEFTLLDVWNYVRRMNQRLEKIENAKLP